MFLLELKMHAKGQILKYFHDYLQNLLPNWQWEVPTGLGLFISKSIVEDYGGRMWAENNSNGKGSGFYFSLPFQRHNPY